MAEDRDGVAFEVNEARAEELHEVRQLLARANEAYRTALPPPAFAAYLALALDVEARAEVASLLVVRDGGRPAGTVTFFADASTEGWGGPSGVAGLRAMAVDPEHRGQGIGTALIDACIR